MEKYAFLGVKMDGEKPLIGVFSVVFDGELKRDELYDAFNSVLNEEINEGQHILYALPVAYEDEDIVEDMRRALGENPQEFWDLMSKNGTNISDCVYVNPSFTCRDVKDNEDAYEAIKVSGAGLAERLARMAQRQVDVSTFDASDGKRFGAACHRVDDDNVMIRIGKIAEHGEPVDYNRHIGVLFPLRAVQEDDSADVLQEWTNAMAEFISDTFGDDLTFYSLKKEAFAL